MQRIKLLMRWGKLMFERGWKGGGLMIRYIFLSKSSEKNMLNLRNLNELSTVFGVYINTTKNCRFKFCVPFFQITSLQVNQEKL